MTIKEDGEEAVTTIKIEGNKIYVDGQDEYGIYANETNDYILFNDFDEDGKADGESRFYYNESKARAYLGESISGGSGGN
jgi:hypothetical protein